MATTVEHKETMPHGSNRAEYKSWLTVDGTVVAYIHLLATTSNPTIFCVCSIEVRGGYRGMGYAKTLMERVETDLSVSLATSGSFTPEGYAAIGHKLPLAPGYKEYKVNCDSMDFVRNWDEQRSY